MTEQMTGLQRLRHHHGETLLARDLADTADDAEVLRHWHNRALHRAAGVVSGLDVMIVDGVATVTPGLAYDGRGAVVRLDEPREIAVPSDSAGRVLVLAGGELCWVARDDVSCAAVVLAGDAAGSTAGRPQVRPLARPRIGRGATVPGATAWRPWTQVVAGRDVQLGIQVTVDTAASGFTAPPCYFVQVTGSLWDPRLPLLLLVPFEHVADAARDRFTVRLLMPWLYGLAAVRSKPDFAEAFRGLAQITELAVTWIGIQHTRGGTP